MDTGIIEELPETPPTHFEWRTNDAPTDTWLRRAGTIPVLVGRGFWEHWTSSSRLGTLENLSRMWLEAPSATSSSTNLIEFLAGLLTAEKRAHAVKAASASENVYELRRLTGFTWERLADLLNVDRRTLNNWVKGAEIRERNRQHIAETLAVMRFVDRGSAEENAAALTEPTVDYSPFEAIRQGRYLNARLYMGYGTSRRGLAVSGEDWLGEFRPMATHAEADGSETLTPLADEPETEGRDRQIERG